MEHFGVWEYAPSGDCDGERAGTDHFVIERTGPGPDDWQEIACPPTERHARLMAAAPAIVSAARRLLDAMDWDGIGLSLAGRVSEGRREIESLLTELGPVPPCPQSEAFGRLADHVKACHPCGRLWAGIGKDRYQHCDEYQRLAAAHTSAPCTCPPESD